MGSRDYWVPENFIEALRRKIPGFKDETAQHQTRLAHYAWLAGTSRRKHRDLDGYMSIGHMDLEGSFGRGGFKAINERLAMFEVTGNWSLAKNLTKGYRLTDSVQAVKAKYLNQITPKLTHLISLDGKAMRTLPAALASKDMDEVTATAWKEAKPLNAIPVDLKRMVELRDHLEQMPANKSGHLFENATSEDVAYRLEILGQLIKLAQTTVAGKGFIAHRYAEGRTGRLYARGISLQTAPRIIRKAALHGLYDYDIENCHYAIFYQLAERYGHECRGIKHYLTHKKATREGIALRVGISQEQVKTCLLALMFGARLTDFESNAIPDEIGQVKAMALYLDAEFAAIAEDITEGRRVILKNWPRRRTTLLNDMKKAVGLKAKPEVRLAHIIQGIEAKALWAAIRLYPDDVVLLMHDGFVATRELDVTLIENAIYQETGYRLELDGGLITLPADLDFSKP